MIIRTPSEEYYYRALISISNQKHLPQLFIKGTFLGGCIVNKYIFR